MRPKTVHIEKIVVTAKRVNAAKVLLLNLTCIDDLLDSQIKSIYCLTADGKGIESFRRDHSPTGYSSP